MAWFPDITRRLFGDKPVNRMGVAGKRQPRRRSFELLEPRIALSAAGLVPVGSQPEGTLSGKIVYTSPGHGYQYEAGAWRTGRGNNNDVVEDFGNQDQLTLYVDYLFRAGATVVPMRPVGRQTNEVVLDNDSAGVTFSDGWSDSVGGRWYDEDYGAVADPVHYRFASTSPSESVTATYTPDIPEAGFYPVYTWVAPGSNRTSQLYKVNHSGGQTEVRVDHSLVGNGWVYLGTYHFNSGSSDAGGSVVISNEGVAGKVVVADAIRFGNGMGDLPMGAGGVGTGTISGKPREEEHSLLWVWRGIGQGVNPSAILPNSAADDSFVAPSIMAGLMNQSAPFGSSVYIGFHSNAFSQPTARGAVGLYHSSNPTPHQSSLATYAARQIDTDMKALGWDWATRTYATSGGFGEINNAYFGSEMDSIIIEVAFHTNPTDAAIMRDPLGRDQIARSVYEATLEYFVNWGSTPKPENVTLPSVPSDVSAVAEAEGQVTVSWEAGPSSAGGYNGANGSPATGYRVYASSDGYGFDGGVYVDGGMTTSVTLSGYDPASPYYFKVVAVNAGGESLASEVATALPSGGQKQALIVNGFDRIDASQNFQYETRLVLPSGSVDTTDRVWSRYNNSFDYVVQVHSAINAAAPGIHVDSTSNEAVIGGAIDLTDYDTVIWILGDESTVDETFNSTEQALVELFVASGGNLLLSGAEIGWDLDRSSGPTAADRAFYNTTLMADYVADDAGTYSAAPAAGGIFAGLSAISFSNGAEFSSLDGQVYDVDYPDVMTPLNGAQVALNYSNGAGAAAIQAAGSGGRGSLVMFGFPFEAITSGANRATVIDRVFDFFGLAVVPPPNADFNGDGTVDAADYTVWRDSLGQQVSPGELGDADFDGEVGSLDYAIWKQQFGTSPGAGGGAGAGDAAAETPAITAAAAVDETAAALESSIPQLPFVASFVQVPDADRLAVDQLLERNHEAVFEANELLLAARRPSLRHSSPRPAETQDEPTSAPIDATASTIVPGSLDAGPVKSLRRLR